MSKIRSARLAFELTVADGDLTITHERIAEIVERIEGLREYRTEGQYRADYVEPWRLVLTHMEITDIRL